jgi:four helix bundle protein
MTNGQSRAPIIRSYEDLQVFQTGMDLLKPVLDLSLRLPDFEKFDLAQQLRRASKSVPANIAEGYAKKRSAKEFRAFLTNAMGSASEMGVHLKIAKKLEYVPAADCDELIAAYDVLGRQLNRLIQRWRSLDPSSSPSNL